MSKMSKVVKETRKEEIQAQINEKNRKVTNFMGGDSFELNPLDTLKMISASSIFGEPAYYRDGTFDEATARRITAGQKKKAEKEHYIKDGVFSNPYFVDYGFITFDEFDKKKTSEVMETAIDNALAYDYNGTLLWAKELRTEFLMRLNPQVIMVRAAMHPNRVDWTNEHPGEFTKINDVVMSRADDVINQLTYYLFLVGSKNKIPTILKRSWASKIESLTRYEVSKYKNKGIGLVDTIRISHANCSKNDALKELISLPKGQAMTISTNENTWEQLRSSGKSWVEIMETIKIPHMALLRNLRGIFKEVDDAKLAKEICEQLVNGVEKGKQFPFRYMKASTMIEREKDVNNKEILKDGLEYCLDKACENFPKLKGKSAFLSDNSGSAWGTCTSEYGTVVVAEIGNLSSYIGAVNSEEGHVFAFGDTLIEYEVSKRQGILSQAKDMSKRAHKNVGGGTENGVWIFLKDAIDKKEHWDNIFIYSDMQAGHGGLYGTEHGTKEYKSRGYACGQLRKNRDGWYSSGSAYINVAKLVDEYRRTVNPKVNVYCIQTAGYDNMLIPENAYRTGFLYGWTGKELIYADKINRFWDEIDARKEQNQVLKNEN